MRQQVPLRDHSFIVFTAPYSLVSRVELHDNHDTCSRRPNVTASLPHPGAQPRACIVCNTHAPCAHAMTTTLSCAGWSTVGLDRIVCDRSVDHRSNCPALITPSRGQTRCRLQQARCSLVVDYRDTGDQRLWCAFDHPRVVKAECRGSMHSMQSCRGRSKSGCHLTAASVPLALTTPGSTGVPRAQPPAL